MIHRSQALDLPCVVRAKSPTPDEESNSAIYDSALGDSRGYYSEGAYVAAPQFGPVLPDEPYSDSEDDMMQILRLSPQEAYTTRLLTLFHQQRAVLHSTALKAWKSAPRINSATAIRDHDPSLTQLATLTTKSVFRLLELVTKCLRRNENVSKRMSAWILAILARMDEREMDSDSVYYVREFGRKAMWVRLGFDERFAEQTETLGNNFKSESEEERSSAKIRTNNSNRSQGEQSRGRLQTKGNRTRRRNTSSPSPAPDHIYGKALEHSPQCQKSPEKPVFSSTLQPLTNSASALLGSQEDFEAARNRLLEKLGPEPALQIATERVDNQSGRAIEDENEDCQLPNPNTKATLDMIITIVGEVYGQRDLLDARIDWVDL
jgi:hypothetical protein